MSTRPNRVGWIVGGLIGMLLLTSWVGCRPLVLPPQAEPLNIKRLLVVPFRNLSEIHGENVTVQDRLSGNMVSTGKVMEGAAQMLTAQLETLLRERKDLEVMPIGQAEGTLSAILSDETHAMPERELLVKIGGDLGADAVLAGNVYRFIQRDGTAYSVRSPASVGFDLTLIRVDDGAVVWTATFDETQQSLSENLLRWAAFWRRKAMWVSAEALAEDGLKTEMENFPVK